MSENKVLFDPGFAPFVEQFSGNIKICNQIMSSLNSLHQKKFKFKVLYPQILKLIENNVAFYYGCLLWAFCIVKQNINSPVEILNNSFYGLNEEELENFDYSEEIDFIIEYLKTFERDSKYYLNKSADINVFWQEILNTYKEFLLLNKGFINVKNTNDVILPERLANIDYYDSLYGQIMDAIEAKHIESLLNIKLFK